MNGTEMPNDEKLVIFGNTGTLVIYHVSQYMLHGTLAFGSVIITIVNIHCRLISQDVTLNGLNCTDMSLSNIHPLY